MSGFSCFFILFAGGPEFGEKHLGLATGSARGPEMRLTGSNQLVLEKGHGFLQENIGKPVG